MRFVDGWSGIRCKNLLTLVKLAKLLNTTCLSLNVVLVLNACCLLDVDLWKPKHWTLNVDIEHWKCLRNLECDEHCIWSFNKLWESGSWHWRMFKRKNESCTSCAGWVYSCPIYYSLGFFLFLKIVIQDVSSLYGLLVRVWHKPYSGPDLHL